MNDRTDGGGCHRVVSDGGARGKPQSANIRATRSTHRSDRGIAGHARSGSLPPAWRPDGCRVGVTGSRRRGGQGYCPQRCWQFSGHAGPKAARSARLNGIPWQQCQFHTIRNAMAQAPKRARRRLGLKRDRTPTVRLFPTGETLTKVLLTVLSFTAAAAQDEVANVGLAGPDPAGAR